MTTLASQQSFMGITGSSAATAKFYLEMAQGDVAAAVDQFYAAGGSSVEASQAPPHPMPQQSAEQPNPGPSESQRAFKQQAQRKPIVGFGDLRQDADESDEEEGNEYYAGGEKSGMVVKGGKGDDPNEDRDVDKYFDMLESAGARRGRPEDLEPTEGKTAAFTGRVRTLTVQILKLDSIVKLCNHIKVISAQQIGKGGVMQESEKPPATPESTTPVQPPVPKVHTITFWRDNVFTVDDGEPRQMTDPANRHFLEAIGRGEAPRELMTGGPASEIQVNCIRSNSDYVAPPKKLAFSGRSQTLAGQRPSPADSQPAPTPSSSQTWEGVDPAEPTTSVQLRLADGSRMVARFNQNHTVADVRRFIRASRPDLNTSYILMTAFPSAELKDDSASLKDAGLLNAVIIQKFP